MFIYFVICYLFFVIISYHIIKTFLVRLLLKGHRCITIDLTYLILLVTGIS